MIPRKQVCIHWQIQKIRDIAIFTGQDGGRYDTVLYRRCAASKHTSRDQYTFLQWVPESWTGKSSMDPCKLACDSLCSVLNSADVPFNYIQTNKQACTVIVYYNELLPKRFLLWLPVAYYYYYYCEVTHMIKRPLRVFHRRVASMTSAAEGCWDCWLRERRVVSILSGRRTSDPGTTGRQTHQCIII